MATSYKELLSDPRWQKKKNDVLIRDNYTCQAADCGCTTKTLHVHHLEYLGVSLNPWDYPMDMLISLCVTCHDKETGRLHLEKNLATTLRMRGFLACDLLALSSKIDSDDSFRNMLLTVLRMFQNK